MKKPHTPEIREVLRTYRDGLTVHQIHEKLPHIVRSQTVKSSLRKMPDAYVDRWTINKGARGQYEAIWCVVIPPLDCPYPTDRYQEPKTVWRHIKGNIHENVQST